LSRLRVVGFPPCVFSGKNAIPLFPVSSFFLLSSRLFFLGSVPLVFLFFPRWCSLLLLSPSSRSLSQFVFPVWLFDFYDLCLFLPRLDGRGFLPEVACLSFGRVFPPFCFPNHVKTDTSFLFSIDVVPSHLIFLIPFLPMLLKSLLSFVPSAWRRAPLFFVSFLRVGVTTVGKFPLFFSCRMTLLSLWR